MGQKSDFPENASHLCFFTLEFQLNPHKDHLLANIALSGTSVLVRPWSGDKVLAKGLMWALPSRPILWTPVDSKRAAKPPATPDGSGTRTATTGAPGLPGGTRALHRRLRAAAEPRPHLAATGQQGVWLLGGSDETYGAFLSTPWRCRAQKMILCSPCTVISSFHKHKSSARKAGCLRNVFGRSDTETDTGVEQTSGPSHGVCVP